MYERNHKIAYYDELISETGIKYAGMFFLAENGDMNSPEKLMVPEVLLPHYVSEEELRKKEIYKAQYSIITLLLNNEELDIKDKLILPDYPNLSFLELDEFTEELKHSPLEKIVNAYIDNDGLSFNFHGKSPEDKMMINIAEKEIIYIIYRICYNIEQRKMDRIKIKDFENMARK